MHLPGKFGSELAAISSGLKSLSPTWAKSAWSTINLESLLSTIVVNHHITTLHTMDALVYRKNTVPQRQRALQADPRPVFQRLPRSRLYMGVFMTLFGVGMYGTFAGFYNMALGKKRPTS